MQFPNWTLWKVVEVRMMRFKGLNPLRFSRIIIVDDSAFFRTMVKKILMEAKIGLKYYEAKDGKEGIAKYVQLRPNITIMDIEMPGVDGIKATMAIKHYDPDAKIIVISSKENKETVRT